MTVAELIAQLQQFPPHLLVVMSKDGEGNTYSPLSDLGCGEYEPDSRTPWYGEFASWADEEGTRELTVEESNALCLWPTN